MTTEKYYELIDITDIERVIEHRFYYNLTVKITTRKYTSFQTLKSLIFGKDYSKVYDRTVKIVSEYDHIFYYINDDKSLREVKPGCSLDVFLEECIKSHEYNKFVESSENSR